MGRRRWGRRGVREEEGEGPKEDEEMEVGGRCECSLVDSGSDVLLLLPLPKRKERHYMSFQKLQNDETQTTNYRCVCVGAGGTTHRCVTPQRDAESLKMLQTHSPQCW